MLSPDEIEQIIASGEGYNAEFKVALPSKLRDLTSEICAFANAAGGVLLLGVNDRNQVKGISIDNKQRAAIQQSISEISPQLHTEIYPVSLPEGEVWVIDIPGGSQKPYLLSGVMYMRQGSNTQKIINANVIREAFQQGGKIYFDEFPIADFDMNTAFDHDFFQEFRMMSGLSANVSFKQIITNLKLLQSNDQVKAGAVLFFGRHPEQWIEKAAIRCVAFEDEGKTQIVDDKIWTGPLYRQYQSAMSWVKSRLNVRYNIHDGNPREEVWEIPEVAFKEAIINALSHRDYADKGGRITIECFPNRFVITNPGSLPGAISPDQFGKLSYSRNPLIFGLFERMRMVEQIGSGIGRIEEELSRAGLKAPVFHFDGIFTVTLPRPASEKASEKTSEKTSEKILRFISQNKTITIEELAKKCKVTERSIERNIEKLKKNQQLKRIGPDKGGIWQIL